MPKYRCKVCDHEVEAKIKPFACAQCKAKGKGFVESSATETAPTETAACKIVSSEFEVPPLASLPTSPVPVPPPRLKPAAGGTRPAAAVPSRDQPIRAEPEQLAWRYALPDSHGERRRPMRGAAVVDSAGRVYVCLENRLVMLEPGTQTPAWEYPTAGAIPRSPTIGPDGHVRIHSSDGFLHVVDSEGKPTVAPVAIGNALGSAVPLVDRSNNTWVALYDGGLQRIDAAGRTTSKPFLRTRRRFDSTGLIFGDNLYIGCEDHYLYAIPLDQPSGVNRWAGGGELGRTGCPISTGVTLAPGPTLLVAGQDDHLHAFGLDGARRWSVALPGQALGTPVVDAQGTVYLGLAQNPRNQTPRGLLAAIDPNTHQIKWRAATEAPVESTPVVGDDGLIYFGDNDGTVHAVDGQGRRQWEAALGVPIRSIGAIVAPRHLAFGLDDGSLAVLKCTSQRSCTLSAAT